jgi:hypothetical protein
MQLADITLRMIDPFSMVHVNDRPERSLSTVWGTIRVNVRSGMRNLCVNKFQSLIWMSGDSMTSTNDINRFANGNSLQKRNVKFLNKASFKSYKCHMLATRKLKVCIFFVQWRYTSNRDAKNCQALWNTLLLGIHFSCALFLLRKSAQASQILLVLLFMNCAVWVGGGTSITLTEILCIFLPGKCRYSALKQATTTFFQYLSIWLRD